MSRNRDDVLARRWRGLVEHRLPRAAALHRGWPISLDHCFARVLLDHACGGPWRARVTPPAWANMPDERLAAAITMGEAVLNGRADLAELNRQSLAWRGKGSGPAARDPGCRLGMALDETGISARGPDGA